MRDRKLELDEACVFQGEWDGVADKKFSTQRPPYYMVVPELHLDIGHVIEAGGLNFNRGSVLKYVWRAGKKPGAVELVDLMKARECLDREIIRLEARDKE